MRPSAGAGESNALLTRLRGAFKKGALVGFFAVVAVLATDAMEGDFGFGLAATSLAWIGTFAAMIAGLVAGISLLLRRDLPSATTFAAGAVFLALIVPIHYLRSIAYWNAYVALAGRSKPLTDAIEHFTEVEGHPPATLEELVPRYLEAVPDTGLRAYPEYRYRRRSAEDSDRDPWEMHVDASSGPMNFDWFVYNPSHEYSEEIYGGRIERIGEWAYVHE